jgi:hypothetical protein
MSLFDIDKVFTAIFPTRSIEYIRNYNFNNTTATQLPLVLNNTSTEVPITVNMSASAPWVSIRDPQTAVNLLYPNGNVVLAPTSSKTVVVIVDLPSDIENRPGTITLRPEVLLDIKSGSFPIVRPVDAPPPSQTERIIVSNDTVLVNVNGTTSLEFTIYDENAVPDFTVTLDEIAFSVDDPTVASADYDYQLITSYSPVTIRGLSVGTTKLNISAKGFTTTVNVQVIPSTSTGAIGGQEENQNVT